MKWILQTLAWLMLSTPVYAAPPDRVQASYEVFSRGIKIGKIDETYTRTKDRYTLSSSTTPLGLLAVFKPGKTYLSSSGLIDKQGLRPQHFVYKREDNPKKNSQAEFDWAAEKINLIHQAQRTPLTLPVGTQDRLSAMYQFMFLQLEADSTLSFAMTNGSKLDNYHYAIGPRQKIDTPAGQFDSLYLDSQGKPGENRTEIWLSTQKHNLPCKMIITDANGDQFTQILSTLHITP
ncbi:MAG: DUF3108 domain-containing protein [Gallionella sp.]|nr:DUF3108 domain-containing protein [Gallionella sp.]